MDFFEIGNIGAASVLDQHLAVADDVIYRRSEVMPQLGDSIRGTVWLRFQADGFLSSWAWIFSIKRAKSIGFVSYSSHPASKHFSRSPGMA